MAQLAAKMVREMMGEKALEYAADATTSEKVEQERVKYAKTANVGAGRAAEGPDVKGMKGPQIETVAEGTKALAAVEKKKTEAVTLSVIHIRRCGR